MLEHLDHASATRRSELARRLAAAFGAGCGAGCGAAAGIAPRSRDEPGVVLEITHRDVIPSTLLTRIAASLGPLVLVVDAARDQVVAWVELERANGLPTPDDLAPTTRMAAAASLRAHLGRGLVLAVGSSRNAAQPPGRELGFVEGAVHGLAAETEAAAPLRIRAYLACEALLAGRLHRVGDRRAVVAATADLAVTLSVLAGRTRVEVHDLGALEAGDIITLDRVYRDAVPAIAAGLDAPIWLEHHAGAFLRVAYDESFPEPDEAPMSRATRHEPARTSAETADDFETRLGNEPSEQDEPCEPCEELDEFDELDELDELDAPGSDAESDDAFDPQGAAERFVEVDALAIDLSVEVARIATTVGELERLAVGAVLATGAPLGRDVVLRSHGQRIADGELVELEGELAVRITATARSTNPARSSRR